MRRITVAMGPCGASSRLEWVFKHLESALPVRFLKGEDGLAGADVHAAIRFQETERPLPAPCRPTLTYLCNPEEGGEPVSQIVEFSSSSGLDPRLPGLALEEASLPPFLPLAAEGSEVLASSGRTPVWVRSGANGAVHDTVSLPSLGGLTGPLLTENIQHRRFFFLLTLLHHLYTVLRDTGWTPPPLRAAFIIDDPNLKRMHYGPFRLEEIASSARKHSYHMSIAASPLDLASSSMRAVEFVRAHAQELSVCIHGNDHLRHEFGRPYTEEKALFLLSQMLARVEAFESRFGLGICRVVVPPHEHFSEQMLALMQRFPLDAVTVSRPKPWEDPRTWSRSIGEGDELLCWFPGDFAAGGMPILRRSQMPQNILFKSFLNQPVIMWYHAWDLTDGTGVLEETASRVNALGNARWMSVGEIALTNYETMCEGETCIVRPWSRRVRVSLPPGCRGVQVELPPGADPMHTLCAIGDRIVAFGENGRTEAHPGAPGTPVTLQLRRSPWMESFGGVPLGAPVGARLRRVLTEMADRLKLRPKRD
ncbi:MAG: hypothetical protein WB626_07965 [Bacteroidota bacterium]